MLAGREASEALQAALERLSPDLREAVILRDLQEMEYREIAAGVEGSGRHGEEPHQSRPSRAGAGAAAEEGRHMTCAELEILLADYLDGTLSRRRGAEVEAHLAACPACAELASDARLAMSFIDRAADIEPPPRWRQRFSTKPRPAATARSVGRAGFVPGSSEFSRRFSSRGW